MRLRPMVRQMPMRLAVGAFILNSGLSKASADETTAQELHGFATTTYPVIGKLTPQRFITLLSRGELAVGAALVVPFVPALFAGAALTGFAGSLLGLYLRTPGMHEAGGLRPTKEGIPLAKDVWLLGVGLSLIADALSDMRGRS
ncbi:MAG TPA: hypothetical protein VGH85_02110 [Mycobacteriales bacterium]